jgi:hypothetical protein
MKSFGRASVREPNNAMTWKLSQDVKPAGRGVERQAKPSIAP